VRTKPQTLKPTSLKRPSLGYDSDTELLSAITQAADSGKGLVVQLGDEDKTIPIAGRITLSIDLLGHRIAYADALHVPDLSVILLSSFVHHPITPCCPFVANHSGCFLTYPGFSIDVDDREDCTNPCSTVPPGASYNFDLQLYLSSGHSSKSDVRRCLDLKVDHAHKACLVALRKSHAHHIESPALPDVSILPSQEVTSSPTHPVYSVPNLGTKST
jgi:hypothetical protein